jgi:hypothetical protein
MHGNKETKHFTCMPVQQYGRKSQTGKQIPFTCQAICQTSYRLVQVHLG